ncbi:hypothetical protein N9P38_01045 [Flavobacteriales bacterium]|nr:hypothetical protein [Flavobacteriales bacterium]
MKKNLLLVALAFSFISANAQDNDRKNKGRIYASYGINKTSYDLSNLDMSGDKYDFRLTHFDAESSADLDFAKFNGKLGYFITEKLAIAIGYDNFTYKAVDTRLVKIGGLISDTTGGFDATYNTSQDVVRTTPSFLTYEYSSLSYINLNLEIHDDFWVSKNGKLAWSYYFGLGGGIVMSESTVSLFGQDAIKTDNGMSGFGGNASFGTKFYFGPVYLDLGGKAGYIQTKDVAIDATGLGKHNFMFASGIASLGVSFNLTK